MNIKIVFLLRAAVCASAQPACPPINFLNAKTINLDATGSSHLTLLRQADGSYTAFETANTSPYAILRTIPHFEQQFSNCLSRPASGSAVRASPLSPAQGVAGQPAVFAGLDSGNYLFVSAGSGSLGATVFDQHLNLVSQNKVGYLDNNVAPGNENVYISLVLADVNGDGKLDLVAEWEAITMGLGGNAGGVQIFLGDGLGGLKAAGSFLLSGCTNGSMAVGDINGDGKPDIVVGLPPAAPFGAFPGLPAGSLVLALGKGDGTFVTSILPTPNEFGPAAIAIADLNGDGKNDLVFLTAPMSAGFNTPNEVAVMLGNGDGTFSPQTVFPVNVAAPFSVFDDPWIAGTVGGIAIGDMNGDGIPDIVTNGITILLGDGKGGFPNRKGFLNSDGESVILTDFNGDGKMDVVIGIGNSQVLSRQLPLSQGYPYTQDSLTVFFGNGDGGLDAAPLEPSPVPSAEMPDPTTFPGSTIGDLAMTAGDFNKDGIADLAIVSAFQYLSVFLGSASDAITPVFNYDFASVEQPAFATSVVAADFNHDGILDLAVSVASPSSDGSIMVFLGKGDGTFAAPVSSPAPGSIWSLVTGNFSKDGRADLAGINASPNPPTDQVVVFLNHGDGTFGEAQTYPAGGHAIALAVGDFNQDGIADIAVDTGSGINLLLGSADGTFSPGANITFPTGTAYGQYVAESLATADLNGDGKLDLAAGILPQGAVVLLGHGDGTFDPPTTYQTGPNANNGIISVVVADINGDGIPDLFLSTGAVLIGDGDGTFRPQSADVPSLFGPLVAADFNGDGKLDVASGFFTSTNGTPPLEPGAAVFFNLSNPAALLNVVSAADFSLGPVAPDSIISAFGKNLALSTASATPPSLPAILGGASVSVQDQTGSASQAEIYYASPGQVNFVLPQSLEPGTAVVTITTANGKSASTEIQIVPLAPKIFLVDPRGIPAGYVVRVGPNNVQTIEPIFTEQGGHFNEVPIDVSNGDVYLVLFGTGFDVPTFESAQIYPQQLTVTYAGPQSQFPA
jgi:uncharacterized protein (TIGR03437 family)